MLIKQSAELLQCFLPLILAKCLPLHLLSTTYAASRSIGVANIGRNQTYPKHVFCLEMGWVHSYFSGLGSIYLVFG